MWSYSSSSGQSDSLQFKSKRKSFVTGHEPTPKRQRSQSVNDLVFTNPGQNEDEITLEFDNQKHLYVSKALLCLSSPVFTAMFDKNAEHIYIENQSKKIKMVGKCYKCVLELLLHIHPRIQKELDSKTVFKIVKLAEEYMIDGSINKCRVFLMNTLKGFEARNIETDKMLKTIVQILIVAARYNYDAIQKIARRLISEWQWFNNHWSRLYNRIPTEEKLNILELRLKRNQDNIMIVAAKQ